MRKALALLCLLTSFSVMAGDPAERKFIREGMTEGQLLVKVGKPDSESADTVLLAGGGSKTIKRWIYLPASGDGQTLTTITISDGKVSAVTREVSR